ncbi:MAG: enoyl-CoA hydratase/isomerase family protein [Bacteroidota bacterium]
MQLNLIQYSVQHHVATLLLNPSEEHNPLSSLLISELGQAFASAQKDITVKVVLFDAQGDAVASGLEPSYLSMVSKLDFEQNVQESMDVMKLLQIMYTLRKPIVMLVDGKISSFGCGLVSASDIIIAAQETALFGCPEVGYGFIPGAFLYFLAKRIGEARAREIALQGNFITAEQAASIGLVTMAVPAINIKKSGISIAQQLASENSGSSMGLVKELLSRIHGMSVNDAVEYISNLNALARMTQDSQKGMKAILNNEKVNW